MKKTSIIRLAALALAVLMAAALFAGCTKKVTDAERIIGRWETEFDAAKAAQEALEAEGEGYEGVSFSDIMIKLQIEFKEDGTYSSAIDQDSAKAAIDKIGEQKVPMIRELFTAKIAEALEVDPSTLTDDDVLPYLSMFGITSYEDFAKMITDEMKPEDIIADANMSGKYLIKDGKLYMSDSADEEATEASDVVAYEFAEDGTLKINAAEGEEIPEGMENMLPLTFTKIVEDK